MHAKDDQVYLRRLRNEFDALLDRTTLVQLAEITGVAPSTIMRRGERDDRLNAWPVEDLLVVAYALRKECPGFRQAIGGFFDRDRHTTRCMSATARAFEAIGGLAEAIREVQAAAGRTEYSPRDVRKLRDQWAQTLHQMIKFLETAETEAHQNAERVPA